MPDVLSRLEAIVGAERVLSGDRAAAYAHDESDLTPRAPRAVVLVTDAAEVEALVHLARELRVPLVGRGAGTGKVGGAMTEGGVVVSFERMTRIVEIDAVDLVAVVEPGVVLKDLQDAVEARGLFYPPDPSSLATCTIGGNIAHNAGGPRAVKYGVTRDWVLGLEAVLGTGERVRVGKRAHKGVAGYDLTALLTGSEGTLGLVTQATLALMPRPPFVETAMCLFASAQGEARALGCVNDLFAAGLVPRTCEFLDSTAIGAVARTAGSPVPQGTSAALIVEVDGTAEACAKDLETIDHVARAGGAIDVLLAQGEAQRRQIWDTRRGVSPALRALRPFKVSEDVAVPRSRLLALVQRVREIGALHGIETAAYGHAGDGNLHVNLLLEHRDNAVVVAAALEAVMRAAVELGGTITAEHGVGLAKQPFLALEQAPAVISAQRRIKAALDPDNILNPGKIWV